MKIATRLILLVGLALEITALLVVRTHEFNLLQLIFILLMALPFTLLGLFTRKPDSLRQVQLTHLITAILIAGALVAFGLILFKDNWDIADPLLFLLLLLPIPQTLTVIAGGITARVLARRK